VPLQDVGTTVATPAASAFKGRREPTAPSR